VSKCGRTCEVWSRVVGYHRPVRNWNKGKQSEYQDREPFRRLEDDGTTTRSVVINRLRPYALPTLRRHKDQDDKR